MALSIEEREQRKEARRKRREEAKTSKAKEEKEEVKEEEAGEKTPEFPPRNCDKPRGRRALVIPIGMASQMVNLDLVADIHGRMTAGIGLEKKGRMVATMEVTLGEARKQLSAIQGKYKKISGLRSIPEFFKEK